MALQRLRHQHDWDIAADSIDIRGWRLYDEAGAKVGVVADLLFDPASGLVRDAVVDLWDRRVRVPVADLHPARGERRVVARGYDRGRIDALPEFDPDAFAREDAGAEPTGRRERVLEGDAPETIRLLAERLEVGKRRERVGEAVVTRTPIVEWLEQDLDLDRDELDVRREPVNRPATGEERIEVVGDEIRIPVIGEEVVVQRRRVVKEIVTIRKRTVAERVHVREPVRHEEVTVEERAAEPARPADDPPRA